MQVSDYWYLKPVTKMQVSDYWYLKPVTCPYICLYQPYVMGLNRQFFAVKRLF